MQTLPSVASNLDSAVFVATDQNHHADFAEESNLPTVALAGHQFAIYQNLGLVFVESSLRCRSVVPTDSEIVEAHRNCRRSVVPTDLAFVELDQNRRFVVPVDSGVAVVCLNRCFVFVESKCDHLRSGPPAIMVLL